MRRLPTLLATALLLVSSSALAPPTALLDGARFPRPALSTGGFVDPTEHNVADAAPILAHAPEGLYVAVGLERAFLGAGLTPKANGLVVLDSDPTVVENAEYNAALLALARDRVDYLKLRFEATQGEILLRLRQADIPENYRKILTSAPLRAQFLAFQEEAGRFPGRVTGFDLLRRPPGPQLAFRGANYLHDDALFSRLQAMARRGRIRALHVDIGNAATVTALKEALAGAQERISVLDISDVWFAAEGATRTSFLARPRTKALLAELAAVAPKDGIVLMTSWFKDNIGMTARRPERGDWGGREAVYWPWNYFGFTFGYLDGENGRESLVDNLVDYYKERGEAPPELHGTLNGRAARIASAKPPVPLERFLRETFRPPVGCDFRLLAEP